MSTIKMVDKVRDFIKSEKYEKAEELLYELRREGDDLHLVFYWLGYLFDDYKNPNHSPEKAKRYFLQSLQYEKPLENAFIRLSRLINNTNHVIRILRHGLEI